MLPFVTCFAFQTLTSTFRHGRRYVLGFQCLYLKANPFVDELIVIYDPDVVGPFESKPFTNPPKDLMTSFERDVERVEAFCTRVQNLSSGQLPSRAANEAFQEVLIGNLNDPPKGLYSVMHENASIMHGYGSAVAIRLGYM